MSQHNVKDFFKGFGSLLTGMKVTITNFLKPPVTLQYPFVKKEAAQRSTYREDGHMYLPERSRGVLRMVDFFDAESTTHKSDYYPGTRFAPCIEGCPAHTDARGYVTLAGEGEFKQGLWTLKRTYPFLGTLGRVCPAPCEDLCTRGIAGPEPIAIRRIKRFYDDYEQELPPEDRYYYSREMKPLIGKKAAVVGAGPAGIQVALELIMEGFMVTIVERKPIPMGYVSLTIPRFRLADEVWQREVAAVMETGRLEVRYNTSVGKDVTMEQLRKDFDFVVIAAGATKPIKLGIPGEDATNMAEGEPWLEAVKLGYEHLPPGKKIVIVGGGSTSTDCARTALRLGSPAVITYRRTRAEMPASHLEVEDAIEEGVVIEFLVSPLEIIKDETGRGTGLKCIRNKLGKRDKSGRRSPVPIEGSEFVIEGDLFMTSLGRVGAMDWLGDEFKKTRSGLLDVNRETNETSVENVFACGDSVQVSTIIAAIADAKKAAHGIFKKCGIDPHVKDLYATGGYVPNVDGSIPKESQRRKVMTPPPGNFEEENPWKGLPYDKPFTTHLWKTPMMMQSEHDRTQNWDECEFGFTTGQVMEEGRRCLSCDSEICIACGICVDMCPDQVIFLKSEEVPEQKDVVYASLYSIDMNLCCYCGMCTEACPTKSIVMTGDYEFSVYNKGNNLITMDRLRIGLDRQPATSGYIKT